MLSDEERLLIPRRQLHCNSDQQAAVIDCLVTPAVTCKRRRPSCQTKELGILAYPGCCYYYYYYYCYSCSSVSFLTSATADAGLAELGAEPRIRLTSMQHPVAVLRRWNLKFRQFVYRSYLHIVW
jgi:hypothetical protein